MCQGSARSRRAPLHSARSGRAGARQPRAARGAVQQRAAPILRQRAGTQRRSRAPAARHSPAATAPPGEMGLGGSPGSAWPGGSVLTRPRCPGLAAPPPRPSARPAARPAGPARLRAAPPGGHAVRQQRLRPGPAPPARCPGNAGREQQGGRCLHPSILPSFPPCRRQQPSGARTRTPRRHAPSRPAPAAAAARPGPAPRLPSRAGQRRAPRPGPLPQPALPQQRHLLAAAAAPPPPADPARAPGRLQLHLPPGGHRRLLPGKGRASAPPARRASLCLSLPLGVPGLCGDRANVLPPLPPRPCPVRGRICPPCPAPHAALLSALRRPCRPGRSRSLAGAVASPPARAAAPPAGSSPTGHPGLRWPRRFPGFPRGCRPCGLRAELGAATPGVRRSGSELRARPG